MKFGLICHLTIRRLENHCYGEITADVFLRKKLKVSLRFSHDFHAGTCEQQSNKQNKHSVARE